MKNPFISVIIPVFNHERFVEDSIKSVLNQTFHDVEVIVINDGSSDKSEDAIKNIKDDRIRYFYQENQGTSNTINTGINISKGQYISVLNSDDIYYLNRFEEIINLIKVNPQIHAIFSYVELIDEQGKSIGLINGSERNWLGIDADTSFRQHNNIVLDLLAGNFLYSSSNLFCNKKVFDHIRFNPSLKYINDYDFFLRLCHSYETYIIKKPLLKYRLHSSNTLSEDFASSLYETSLVLSSFLINYDISEFKKDNQLYENMAKFINSLNTYDTDRIIMTILLFFLKYSKKNDLITILNLYDNVFRKSCIERLKKYHDKSSINEMLQWQREQTEMWWRKSEELKNELQWQREQTEMWWRKSEELKNEFFLLNEQNSKILMQLDSILESNSWQYFQKFGKIIDKILPYGTSRRKWASEILKKYFKSRKIEKK